MSWARYRQALKIIEMWPKDPSKGEHRDIAVLLRKRIGESFKGGEEAEISDPEKCDKMLASLENICDDKHKKAYKLTPPISVGALGLDYEVAHEAVSDETLEELGRDHNLSDPDKQSKKSFFSRLFRRKNVENEEKTAS